MGLKLKYGLLLITLLMVSCAPEEKQVEPKTTQPAPPKVSRTNTLKAALVKPKKQPELAQKKEATIKVTFIELGSIKCIPCKMMQPIMDEIAREYKGQVKVVFYDVWTTEGRPYAEKYGIRGIPTQVFLDKNGEEFHRHHGFFPKEELIKVLKLRGVE